MQARLICQNIYSVVTGDLTLDQFPLLLGRGPEADVRLDDRWVSRRHCELDCVYGQLVVRDLDSRHGTMVNGSSIREARLEPGDRLSVGMTTFRVETVPDSSGRLEVAGVL